MATVREEQPEDIGAVRVVNEAAFGQPTEAVLVDSIRAACPDSLSLIAVEAGKIVGHILFSPVTVSTDSGLIQGMGLAPMAVAPEVQRHGVGSQLAEAGIAALRERKCPFIIVLGHPEFYPRFGFVPASQHDLSCQWDGVPDEAFMVLVLDEATMNGVSGVARYRPEFDQAM